MGFSDAIRSGFSNYFNFSGRALRSEYWYFHLFFLLCITVFFSLTTLMNPSDFLAGILGLVALVGYLVFIIPSISVGVRRLHDRNMAGWWYLIIFAPFGSFVLLVLFVLKGSDGPNDYGPYPSGNGRLASQDYEPAANDTDETYSRSQIPKVDRK